MLKCKLGYQQFSLVSSSSTLRVLFIFFIFFAIMTHSGPPVPFLQVHQGASASAWAVFKTHKLRWHLLMNVSTAVGSRQVMNTHELPLQQGWAIFQLLLMYNKTEDRLNLSEIVAAVICFAFWLQPSLQKTHTHLSSSNHLRPELGLMKTNILSCSSTTHRLTHIIIAFIIIYTACKQLFIRHVFFFNFLTTLMCVFRP